MSNYYIVWNADKSEGFATTDKGVAYEARKGAESNCFTGDGDQSKLAQAFCEIWSHEEDCTMVECGKNRAGELRSDEVTARNIAAELAERDIEIAALKHRNAHLQLMVNSSYGLSTSCIGALQALLNMDVNGHALQDRLQFSDKGRALLEQARHALGVAL